MFETKLIVAVIILSFLLVYPLTELHSVDRNKNPDKKLPKNKLTLLIIRISSVL